MIRYLEAPFRFILRDWTLKIRTMVSHQGVFFLLPFNKLLVTVEIGGIIACISRSNIFTIVVILLFDLLYVFCIFYVYFSSVQII